MREYRTHTACISGGTSDPSNIYPTVITIETFASTDIFRLAGATLKPQSICPLNIGKELFKLKGIGPEFCASLKVVAFLISDKKGGGDETE